VWRGPSSAASLTVLAGRSAGFEGKASHGCFAKPTRTDTHEIVDIIWLGSMGTVFRGNKVLTVAAEDPDLLTHFYREAKYRAAFIIRTSLPLRSRTPGRNSVPGDGIPGLREVRKCHCFGPFHLVVEKLGIILQVCNGLTYAHMSDLAHRYIKPANIIILGDGTAKIVDFGIFLLGGSRLTRPGHIVGSLNYMSPAQLGGDVEVDVRTDVHSTGVVLFQC
jgi:serine/threonine protein kinase